MTTAHKIGLTLYTLMHVGIALLVAPNIGTDIAGLLALGQLGSATLLGCVTYAAWTEQ